MSRIEKSLLILGDISGEENLHVDGCVEGQINLRKNQITIGASGKVKADMQGESIVIAGEVHGNVQATEFVEVQSTGRILGHLTAPRVVVREGGFVKAAVSTDATEATNVARAQKVGMARAEKA